MIDFHFDEERQTRVVGSLNEVRSEIEQAIAAKVTEIYSIWTKPAYNLEPAKSKLKIAMQPYMELAAQ